MGEDKRGKHNRLRGLERLRSLAVDRDGARSRLALRRQGPEHRPLLSSAQERLWFLEELAGGAAIFNVPAVLELRGVLNRSALAKATESIVRRHPALRTRIDLVDGYPEPRVSSPETVPDLRWLSLVDGNGGDGNARQRQEAIAKEVMRPFDLNAGPLFRLLVVMQGDCRHTLIVTMHHIVTDGWSMNVLLHELGQVYSDIVQNKPGSLPPLPIDYTDFGAWQREWLASGVGERQLKYWVERLAPPLPSLNLPTDRQRPASPSHRGASIRSILSPALVEGLAALGRRHQATLSMVLLAAFKGVLARWSGDDDIFVGSVVSGRNRSELRHVVGFFTNTLALRTDLSGDPSFSELLLRVKDSVAGAYAHQDVPFDQVVAAAGPARDAAVNPLFQVMYTFQDYATAPPSYHQMEVERLPVDNGTSQFDLTLFAERAGREIRLRLEYSVDLFDENTVERLLARFTGLLESAAAAPDSRLSELAILPASEIRQLLVDWNDTAAPVEQKCVQALFAEQVARRPDATAIQLGDQRLSYAELDRRSTQLARYLRGLGVDEEDLVAIHCERSFEMVIGLLGILKAGGAYLPLDTGYPVERLAFMLEDAGAKVVVTQSRLLERLPKATENVVCLDSDWHVIAANSSEPLGRVSSPENLAYVIYTSGSTGAPKGVMVEHRNIANLVACFEDIGPNDVLLLLAPLAFDASTFEIWVPLSRGAKLAIFPQGTLDPHEIGNAVAEGEVTALFLTSALFNLVVDTELEKLKGLRLFMTGGDVVSPHYMTRAVSTLRDTKLINGYGPTETTTVATLHHCRSPEPVTVPIGRPIYNTRLFVLDRHLGPVPIGAVGELYISGAGVSRGYWRRPELTAKKFLHCPSLSEGRLYRTGDLVRYRANGDLEFIGRSDQQVKIRGFRVELGEIEHALRDCAGVDEAVLVIRETASRGKRLVAYAIGEAKEVELREELKRRLPNFMVPARILSVDHFPTTDNGKIDRDALPDGAAFRERQPASAPETPVEKAVASVWARLLGQVEIGRHDDFFDSGGNSLLAVQAAAALQSQFGFTVPVAAFFEAPTLKAFSALLVRRPGGAMPFDAVGPEGAADYEEGVL